MFVIDQQEILDRIAPSFESEIAWADVNCYNKPVSFSSRKKNPTRSDHSDNTIYSDAPCKPQAQVRVDFKLVSQLIWDPNIKLTIINFFF